MDEIPSSVCPTEAWAESVGQVSTWTDQALALQWVCRVGLSGA